MGNFANTTPVFAAFALTLFTSVTPSLVAAQNNTGVHNKTVIQSGNLAPSDFRIIGQPGETHSATPDPFCPPGYLIVAYEEDINGDRIPGTEDYGCAD